MIRYGRKGSIQETLAAPPEIPPIIAIKGAIQQSDDAMAATTPVPIAIFLF